MGKKPTKYEKRGLYKLILARNDITSALFACRFFIENVKDIKNELWLSLQEAIIISYARPFTENKPLGPIRKSWNKMPNPEMQKIHNMILEARDKQIAHSDLEQNKVFIIPKGVRLAPDYHVSSSTGVEVHSFKFPIPFFKEVEKLCLFLGRKIHYEIEDGLHKLYGDLRSDKKIELDIDKDD